MASCPGGTPGFCFKVPEMVQVRLEVRGSDPARTSCGGGRRRRRAWIQDRGSLGRVPGRWASDIGFILSGRMSVFCGSLQSVRAMEFPPISGWAVVGSGDSWQRRCGLLECLASTGSRDLVVIFVFLVSLCALCDELSSVSLYDILVFVCFS